MSTHAAVPADAAAASHGTPGSAGGCGFGAGLGFGLVLVGAGFDVVVGTASLDVVAGAVVVCDVVGVPPPVPAATAPPPALFGVPPTVAPPEHAASTNAVASAAAPTRSLFTIPYPQQTLMVTLTSVQTGVTRSWLFVEGHELGGSLHPGVEIEIHPGPIRAPTFRGARSPKLGSPTN